MASKEPKLLSTIEEIRAGEVFKPDDLKDEEKLKKEAERLAKELGEDPEKVEKDLKRRRERRQKRDKER